MEIEEKQIIQNCQTGQRQDFGWLYDKYIKKIYNFIYYKTHHRETAEDLTSQTFFKALRAIDNFDLKKGSFSAWLYRIARNTVTDFYRTQKADLNIDDVWDLASDQDTARDAEIQISLAKVKKYLSRLPVEQRDIVMLRVWEGLDYQTISEIVGKSEASCKMTFSRTVSKMRQELVAAMLLLLLTQIVK